MRTMEDKGDLTSRLTIGFRCLPNYGNDLRKQYTNLLQLIGKSNLLQFLISQILKRKVAIGKLDEDMWKEIGDAEYALS